MKVCESKFGESAELGSLGVGKLHFPQDRLHVFLCGPAHGNPGDGNALHSWGLTFDMSGRPRGAKQAL